MRYYFDFDSEGGTGGRAIGMVLADHNEARAEGRKALAEVAKEKIGSGGNRASLTIQSETGQIVFKAEMAVFECTPGRGGEE